MNMLGGNGHYVIPGLAGGVALVGMVADRPLEVASKVLSLTATVVQTVGLGALDLMSWIGENPKTSLPLLGIVGSFTLSISAGNDLDCKPQRKCSAFCKLAIVAVILPLSAMKFADPERPFFTQN